MKLHKDSHVDHGLSAAQLAHLLLRFEERDGFFIETVTLPESLGTAPCNLYGPIMGDESISPAFVGFAPRPGRSYASRRLVSLPSRRLSAAEALSRRSNQITVIAGPHDGHPCVLFTAFGGPLAPKEPDDPTLKPEERDASIAFWSEHALAF